MWLDHGRYRNGCRLGSSGSATASYGLHMPSRVFEPWSPSASLRAWYAWEWTTALTGIRPLTHTSPTSHDLTDESRPEDDVC